MVPNPPPTAGTPVDLSKPNLLSRYRKIGRVLGTPKLHGWQETWLAGASELKPDGTRRRRRCGLMLGRQGGKTEIIKNVAFEAAASGLLVGYTAQERNRAEEKWRAWCDQWQDNAPAKWKGKMKLSKGQERLILPSGGVFRILSPNAESPRGPTLDVVICDEAAWVTAAFLDAAMGTLSARPQWVVFEFCTAGDANKPICAGFEETRKTGLASLEPDAGPELEEVFWQEYAATPEDDPGDEAVWERVIPTLDSVDPPGVQRSLIRSEYEKHKRRGTLHIFTREYLSVWTMPPKEQRFDIEAWSACAADVEVPLGSVVSVDIDPARENAAICAAYAHTVDDVVVEVVRARQGSEWVAKALDELRAKHPNRFGRVVLDPMATGGLETELRMRGFWTETISHQQYARYWGAFVDLVKRRDENGQPGLRQRPHPALDAAVQAASVRKLGEGSAWNKRADANAPICALVAATLAVGAAQEAPQPERLVM